MQLNYYNETIYQNAGPYFPVTEDIQQINEITTLTFQKSILIPIPLEQLFFTFYKLRSF